MKSIKSQLQEGGYKLTPQREATVRVLLEKEKDHLSAEEIFMYLRRTHPDIGLATVYRTLEILTQLQVTNRVVFEDGLARYDLRRKDSGHFHHHLLCMECGGIEEIHEDLLLDVEKDVEARYHFLVRDHRLTFHGICHACQEKQAKQMAANRERGVQPNG